MGETITIGAILLLVYSIALFCLPFYVFRIRNEIIKLNEQAKRTNELLTQIEKGLNQPRQIRLMNKIEKG
jgi:hypothetical protein